MPPRAKITKDMIVDAAFEVARKTGAENINARTVSNELNCSTQPVMYHFETIEALKSAAYKKTDEYHTEYLMNIPETWEDVMLAVGFLIVTIFYRSGSLLPCIITHSAINTLNTFANEAGFTMEKQMVHVLVMIVIAIAYTLILTKTLPKNQPQD